MRGLATLFSCVIGLWLLAIPASAQDASAAANAEAIRQAVGHVDVQVHCPAQRTAGPNDDRRSVAAGRRVTINLSKPGDGYKQVRPLLLAGAAAAAPYRCPMWWTTAAGDTPEEGYIGALDIFADGKPVFHADHYSPYLRRWEGLQDLSVPAPAAAPERKPSTAERTTSASEGAKPASSEHRRKRSRPVAQASAAPPAAAAAPAPRARGHGRYAMFLIFAGMAMMFGGVFLTPFGGRGVRVLVGIVAGFILCAGGQVLLKGGPLFTDTPLLSSLVLLALGVGWAVRLTGGRAVGGDPDRSATVDYGYGGSEAPSEGGSGDPGRAQAYAQASGGQSASGSGSRPIHTEREHKFTGRDGYSVRADDPSRMNHYSKSGKPAGYSKVTTNWLGDVKTKHVNAGKKSTGYSRTTKGIFGDVKTVHYNSRGERTGSSRPGSDIFGNPRTNHYDKAGNKTGHSKSRPGGGGGKGSGSSHTKRRK